MISGITDNPENVPAPVLLFTWLPYTMKASQKRDILNSYHLSLLRKPASSPGWSALVSGWLELGDEIRAQNALAASYRGYVRGPFQVQ